MKCHNCNKPIRFWQKAYWVDDERVIHTRCVFSKFGYRQKKHLDDLISQLPKD